MRIRTIKPEFFSDEILDELPADVRIAFAGLWCYCDDFGRGLDDRWLIKAAIAPRRDKDTPNVVEGWLEKLADAGRLLRYEIDGRRYLQIINWHHQKINRPTPSRYPPPSLTEDSLRTHEQITEGSSRAREEVEVGSGKGTGNREETCDLPPAAQDGFDSFWLQYPERNGKKLDKGKTLAAWQRLGQTQRTSALRGVAHYRTDCDEGLTIAKDPLRWLQGKCWVDWQEPSAPTALPPAKTNGWHPPEPNRPRLPSVDELRAEAEAHEAHTRLLAQTMARMDLP